MVGDDTREGESPSFFNKAEVELVVQYVADILAGSDTVFFQGINGDNSNSVLQKCETWYEWLVGKLLYSNPVVKVYELAYYAEEALSKFGGLTNMTALDSVLLAAMELDIPQV